MGLLSKFFPRNPKNKYISAAGYQTFTEYNPVFLSWHGKLYEQALVRAVIERFATACSKLKPEYVCTAANPIRRVSNLVNDWPNEVMSWPRFLARLATLQDADTTAFIAPILNEFDETVGLFPLKPATAEVVSVNNVPWMQFSLYTGETLAIELDRVGIVTRFQYISDIFGAGNDALHPTLALIDAQEQAEKLAVQNGARIRFIGKLTGQVHEEDMEKKRQRFYEKNLSQENQTGLMMYDNTFDSVKQIEEQRFVIDTEEMERINNSVYDYFGINKDILQNTYSEEEWGAYYEGRVESFALQVSEAITKMVLSPAQRKKGNHIMFSSNRLEYATNASKRNMVRDMIDRGVMSINEGREVLQLPPIEGGDVFFARGEYKDAQGIALGGSVKEKDFDLGGDDDIYNDTDSRGEEDKFDD